MSRLSAKLRKLPGMIAHWCPACDQAHVITVDKDLDDTGPCWDWDRNVDLPTISPSVRTFDDTGTICHYFLKSGQIQYLGDCRHIYANQTIILPDWPWAEGEYAGV